ncbi:hypothetical protein [Bacillus sp. NEB1478]|uniref:response regulator aspartate phosphatase n=1 Tax=Bacillus sp. NEB1478 TaxID=3073816 RepID=UPI002873552E|nr:hypothetical protein [Bacillus sp. NEB1478]WNB92592.1 hypothetical protein RGB74_02690 [Bacillus sp. NEB1478]
MMNITSEPILQTLERWHTALRTNRLQESEQIHKEIKTELKEIQNSTTQLYYQLLNSRYLILQRDFTAAHAILDNLSDIHLNRADIYGYYINLISGILLTLEEDYELAETRFIRAYQLLNNVTDETIRADFYYRASLMYYHIRQPLTVLNYANEALRLLSETEGYELFRSGCENIQGLASLSLKQYGKAEEHFLSALDLAKKVGEDKYNILIKYNIGFLYAEQNMSELAIRYLLEVYNEEDPYFRTHFLLTREYYRINDRENAEFFYNKGIEIGSEEYKHHFEILRVLNNHVSEEEFEKIFKDGVHYFTQHELHGFIEDYSGEFAQYFHNKEDHQKASQYFNMAYEAKKALQKKEALR